MNAEGNRRTSSGAYGFRLVAHDPEVVIPHLARVDDSAPAVQISWAHASAVRDERWVDTDRVVLSHRRGGSIVITRSPAEARLVLPRPTSAAAIVHPLGTLPLSVFARWRGYVTLHGGAFVHGGGALLICGERTAGKSTMLALLAQRRVPIVADDLVVCDGHEVLAGPQCIDLRPDAARYFSDAEDLGRVGARDRHRLVTTPAPSRAQLRAVVLLEWGAHGPPEISALGPAERLRLLYAQQYSTLFKAPDEQAIMDLLDIPMYRVRRARDWDRSEEAADRLMDLAAAQ